MKKLVTVIALAGLIGTPVLAADLNKPVYKAPPPPPPAIASCNWCGWYVGINGGGVWGRTDPNLTTPIPNSYFLDANALAVEAAGSQSFNNSGGLAGGQIGYLTQLSSLVFGLEAGFDWMAINGSSTTTQLYPAGCVSAQTNCAFTLTDGTKTEWLFTLLGRVGWSFGNWYPYVTGGLAVAEVKYSVAFSDNNIGVFANTAGSFSQVEAGGNRRWL